MQIKEIRHLPELSQIDFAAKYKIPRRTLEDWERENVKSNPPDYYLETLEYKVKADFLNAVNCKWPIYNGCTINEVRILVTSSEEFQTENDLGHFIEYELPEASGQYRYREKGIRGKNILVLFWHHEHHQAIGCGILEKMIPGEKEDGIYKGKLHFYPETIIKIEGITEQEIHQVSSMPKRVIQGSPKMDKKNLIGILNLVAQKRYKYIMGHAREFWCVFDDCGMNICTHAFLTKADAIYHAEKAWNSFSELEKEQRKHFYVKEAKLKEFDLYPIIKVYK